MHQKLLKVLELAVAVHRDDNGEGTVDTQQYLYRLAGADYFDCYFVVSVRERHGGGVAMMRALAYLTDGKDVPVVIKRLKRDPDGERERRAMEQSRGCKRVIPLVASYTDTSFKYYYLAMPMIVQGDLFDCVNATRRHGLREGRARRWFMDMLQGLCELKALGMAHGDISLENVMLPYEQKSRRRVASLTDLGSVCHRGQLAYPYLGKPNYIPPEHVRDDVYAPIDVYAADIWSLGVALYIMLTGKSLYKNADDGAYTYLLRYGAGRLISAYGALAEQPAARGLICSMLRVEPDQRPTLEQVMLNPWVCDAHEQTSLSTGG